MLNTKQRRNTKWFGMEWSVEVYDDNGRSLTMVMRRKKVGRSSSRPAFKYKPRPAEAWRAKAQESAGNFDRFVNDGVDRFSPRDGPNRIRILPPTWDEADDWAYRLYVHYGVGSDNQSYLCPRSMGKESSCPVCEEVERLAKDGDAEDANRLKAKKRSACWLIDRNDEDAGPKFWAMPFTVARDANAGAQDEDGQILELDRPDKGYDLLFAKEGSKDRTKYIGVKLARKSSPISDDEDHQTEWLDYVMKNPIPDILKFYDSEYIANVLGGKVAPSEAEDDDYDEDEDEEEVRPRRKASKPSSKRARVEEEDEEEEREDDDDDDDDDDEDEEDEDEDEEEDAPRRRRSLKKKSSRDDDEDEDDDDGEDEDEDEEGEDEDDDEPRRGKSSVTRRLERASGRASGKRR